MKKSITIFLILLLMLSTFSACDFGQKSDKISIVTTIFPQYDTAKAIAGDKAEIKMLLSPGQETHSYEPTPKDIKSIEDADIFIYTGGESDAWLKDILSSIDTSNTKIIALTDIVAPIKEHDGHDHSQDEHVWTSPYNVIMIANEICNALCDIDTANTEYYKNNCADHTEKLDRLDKEFMQAVSEAKRNTLVFADRFPLLHFVKRYSLDYKAAYPGCADNTEPSPTVIAELIDYINTNNIPVIFKIELSNGNIAETISEATGAKVLTFFSCHNISRDDFESGKTYISLMQDNLTSLKEALG